MLIFSLLLLAACSLGIPALNQACARGRIKVNPLVGIRTAKTMASADAWKAGHAVTVQPMWVSGIAAAAISLAGLLFLDAPGTQMIMVVLACALLVVSIAYGTRLANVAAVESLTVETPRR
ncbi:SdpI family protein [Arthrobacter sp. LAPM80]|uniref:SdpI family protein n=1 Tax=Arthrobacter sp. LAPM80 TaxID=3141788 RepID=UPI00398B81E6